MAVRRYCASIILTRARSDSLRFLRPPPPPSPPPLKADLWWASLSGTARSVSGDLNFVQIGRFEIRRGTAIFFTQAPSRYLLPPLFFWNQPETNRRAAGIELGYFDFQTHRFPRFSRRRSHKRAGKCVSYAFVIGKNDYHTRFCQDHGLELSASVYHAAVSAIRPYKAFKAAIRYPCPPEIQKPCSKIGVYKKRHAQRATGKAEDGNQHERGSKLATSMTEGSWLCRKSLHGSLDHVVC